ncbi:serralysin-like metalloprotease domain-containing protein (plasmid) [Rhizobium phaseoli]|nr:serralysin-like metalloprotease domain-containing protein [Rhizobium phaseoli]
MPSKLLKTSQINSVRFKDQLFSTMLVGSEQEGMVSGSILTSLPSTGTSYSDAARAVATAARASAGSCLTGSDISGVVSLNAGDHTPDEPATAGMTTQKRALEAPREIAFIDQCINDLETFLSALRPEVEAIVLSDGEPAIRQMARHLSTYSRLERVHVVAHGAPGEIRFSSGTVSERDIAGSTDVFAKIGAALGENGSMQLWCCATGKNEVGKSFAQFLHRCLSRSVAAASGFIGAVALGGSWCLDLQFGNAAPRPPLTRSGLAAYQGVLANFSATPGQDNQVGGPGADTFKISAGTVQSSDIFDGRGGIDTLNVMAAADFSVLPAGSLLSMEILSISGSGTGVTFNANQFSAKGLSLALDLRGSTGNQTVIIQNASNFSAAAWTFGGSGSSLWGNNGNDIIAIIGTSGADAITGSSSADTITGGSGADTLAGGGGDDTFVVNNGDFTGAESIDGGAGANTLLVAGINNFTTGTLTNLRTLNGSAGNDTVTLTGAEMSGFTTVNLGSGSDTLNLTSTSTGLNGRNDSQLSGVEAISAAAALAGVVINLSSQSEGFAITGSAGADTITGGSGADTFTGGSGTDTLVGGGGDDTFVVNNGDFTGAESINGGVGANILSVAGTNNFTTGTLTNLQTLNGSSGSDTVMLTGAEMNGFTTVNLGSGSDTLNLTSTSSGLNGRNDSQLSGVEAISAAAALAGVVINLSSQAEGFTITGSSGADTITGGGGNDTLDGGSGNDTLVGAAGNDSLFGSGGSDVLIGGVGNDVLYDESGDDVLDGGDGDDTMSDFGGAVASLSGGAGNDAMWTGANMTGTVDGGSDRDVLFVTGGNLTGLTISNVEIYTTSAEFVLGTVTQLDGFDTITTFDDPAHASSLVDIRISGGGSLDLSDELGLRSAVVTADATAGNGITTGVGNDTITGGGGNDTLDGGSGNDTLVGAAGNDSLFGSGGSDVLIGGEGNDVLYDESGDDVLDGGNGDDTMSDFGGAVASLSGGAGNDAMWTGANMTGSVDGGSDRDVLFVTGGNLTGLAISNVEIYTTSAEFVLGTVAQLDGFDTITTFDDPAHAASQVDIWISGGGSLDLSDELGLRSAVVTADATAGNGITTGVGNDTITGGAGNDTLDGGSGNDTLVGAGGSDSLFGSGGSDVLIGGVGNDVLYDESGDDVLDGGDGDDTMSDFGGAVASLSGGAGNDAMWTGANMTGTVDGGSGRDVLFVTGGNLTGLAISNVEIYTTSAEFVLGTVAQLDGFDTITTFDDPAHAASLVDIRISGGGSLDLSDELGLRSAVVTADATAGNGITTGVGNDTITGGAGNDTLDGGSGNDTISGGLGNDTFVFAANLSGNSVIGDFNGGPGVGDLISIANSAFESFADILAAGEDTGTDWLLTIDDDTTLRLAGVNESSLAANDFWLV